MSELNHFEQTVLSLLLKQNLNWYQLSVRLSSIDLEDRPHLGEVLTQLANQGFVIYVPKENSTLGQWELTDLGKDRIEDYLN